MPMTPAERKAELVKNGTKIIDIAKALGVSQAHVSRVVKGERRSPTVEAAVADAIGKPVKKVFGAAA